MYESFIIAAEKYGETNVSLERIDSDLSYSKENCKWIKISEQQGNTTRNRNFRAISPKGEVYFSKNLSKFCKKHDLNRSAVLYSIKSNTRVDGWKIKYI